MESFSNVNQPQIPVAPIRDEALGRMTFISGKNFQERLNTLVDNTGNHGEWGGGGGRCWIGIVALMLADFIISTYFLELRGIWFAFQWILFNVATCQAVARDDYQLTTWFTNGSCHKSKPQIVLVLLKHSSSKLPSFTRAITQTAKNKSWQWLFPFLISTSDTLPWLEETHIEHLGWDRASLQV